jgi:hypothetical protein
VRIVRHRPEIVADATRIAPLPGVTLPVACIPHLIAMKVVSENAIRIQDKADLQVPLRVASESELKRAREFVALITDRGFHRDLDLLERLEDFSREFRK